MHILKSFSKGQSVSIHWPDVSIYTQSYNIKLAQCEVEIAHYEILKNFKIKGETIVRKLLKKSKHGILTHIFI